MSKRLFAILLLICLAFSAIPLSALSESATYFDIAIDAPTCYSVGDTVTVGVRVNNITHPVGLSYIRFILRYDADKLTLKNRIDFDAGDTLDCVTSLPVGTWENLSVTDTVLGEDGLPIPSNNGVCDVSALTVDMACNATSDGELAFAFYFEVKDTSGDITVSVSDGEVTGSANEQSASDALNGRGATAVIGEHSLGTVADENGDWRCSACDKVIAHDYAHVFTDYIPNGDATCLGGGTKTAKCDYCDATDTLADPDTVGAHSYGEYSYNNDATCTEDGTETAVCTVCSTPDVRIKSGSVLGHSFTTYIPNEGQGTKTAKCDRCDETDTVADRTEPEVDSLLGAENSETWFDAVITAPKCYSVGDIIDVDVVIKNITYTDGISYVDLDVLYDPTQLMIKNEVNLDAYGALECVTNLPNKSAWESLCHVAYTDNGDYTATPVNDGLCELSALTTNMYTRYNAKNDGDIAFRLRFEVLEGAKGDIAVYAPHAGVKGAQNVRDNPEGVIRFSGKGSSVTVTEHIFTDYASDNNATCIADGTKTAACSYGCGATETVTDTGSALGHGDSEPRDAYYSESDGKWYRAIRCTRCEELTGSEEITEAMLGDVCIDFRLDSLDCTHLKRYIVGTLELDGLRLRAGDVNIDGCVNSLDYIILKRAVLGTIQLD